MTSNPRIVGSLRSADGKGVVRMEDRFEADIDEVWSALTDQSRLASWYGEGEDLADLVAGLERREDAEARWKELHPAYQDWAPTSARECGPGAASYAF